MPLNRLPNFINSNISLTGVSADYLDGIDLSTISSSLRANRNITGGGTITFDASGNLIWSDRFIVMSNGRGPSTAPVGYFDIYMPPVGTTVIGLGGAGSRTVSASGITIGGWEALYYILPTGISQITNNSNFRIVSYLGDVDIPHDWVLLAIRNGDITNQFLYLNNGIVLAAGQSDFAGRSRNVFVGASNTENYIAFRGTTGDNPGGFDHGYIGERVYGGAEQSELLIFKGNDNDTSSGLDRIRLLAAGHRFDTYSAPLSGPFSTVASAASVVRMTIDSTGVSLPRLNFSGGTSTITAQTLADGTISFDSTAGQLFSISNSLTGTIFSINDISGLPSMEVTDLGIIKLNELYGQTVIGSGTPLSTSSLTVYPRTSSSRGLTVKGVSSQSADIFNVQSSADTQFLKVDQSGNVYANPRLFVGVTSYVDAYRLYVQGSVTTEVTSVVRGVASQTADLQQWQNSAGSVLAKVDSAGVATLNGLVVSSQPAQINNTVYGFNINPAANLGATTYWKIATLPSTTLATYDAIYIEAVLGGWASNNKTRFEILMGNRDAFTYKHRIYGPNLTQARILAYTETNGEVSVYLYSENTYTTLSYNISLVYPTTGTGTGATIFRNPTGSTSAPTGTLAFDSSSGSYPALFRMDNSGNSVTSGSSTAASFIPNSATIPTNGMYLSTTNTLNFATNTTNRMSIDSSGNVGIGGSPIAANGRLSVIGGRTYLAANSETYSLGLMYSSSTGQYYVGATNAAAPDLVFSNSGGTERMRITDAGNVGIGITPGYKLDVAGVGRFKSGTEWPVIVQNNSATSTNRNHIIFQRDNNGAAVTANFNLGGIGMAGYDGASYGLGWNGGIEISGFAAETWTSAARGSYLTITTTPTGTITPQERLRIDAAGNVGIGAAPSASYILDIQKTGSGTSTGIRVYNSATAASSGARIDLQQGAVNTFVDSVSNSTGRVGTSTNHPLQIITNNTERIGITAAGVTTVSGVALGTTATNESIISNMFLTTSNADYIRAKYRRVSNGSDWQTAQAKIQRVVDVTDMGYLGFGGTSTYDVRIGSGTSDIAIFAPSSITLGSDSVKTTGFPADGTTSTATTSAGYMGMPQVQVSSGGRTLAATDAGKHIYVTTNSSQTITIPANSAVAFPVGTTIVIVNANTISTSIAITTDTLRLANSTSTGTRTLASNGMCTLLKIANTEWIASGNGLT